MENVFLKGENSTFLVTSGFFSRKKNLSFIFHKAVEDGALRESEDDWPNRDLAGILYDDEMWSSCPEGVHPGWLHGFRVVAFFLPLAMLIITSLMDGGSVFYCISSLPLFYRHSQRCLKILDTSDVART